MSGKEQKEFEKDYQAIFQGTRRLEELIKIANRIDQIQRHVIYDTTEAAEARICEAWLKQFCGKNEPLHRMELVYKAFILWKLRWIREDINGLDTDSNSTYYRSIDEFIEEELVRAQG